jgi:hypothetical protein
MYIHEAETTRVSITQDEHNTGRHTVRVTFLLTNLTVEEALRLAALTNSDTTGASLTLGDLPDVDVTLQEG